MEKNESKIRKLLIITGGSVNIEWAKKWLASNQFDYIMAADKGLVYADALKCKVDFILGDYDSVDKDLLEKYKQTNVELRTFPCEKDDTDTHLAITTGIKIGVDEITILGAIGTRLDHTIANIENMKLALEEKIPCFIVNENNKVYLSNSKVVINKNEQYGKFISLIPLTELVHGVTLNGFYYSLEKYDLKQGYSLGISNEIVEDNATIEFDDGIIIIFETKD